MSEREFCERWLGKSECYMRTLRFSQIKPSADALATVSNKLKYYSELYDAQSTVHLLQRGAARSPTTLTLSMLHAHTHVRCWHVETTHVHRTLVDATEHRLIERWGERIGRWLYRWYYLRLERQ